MCGRVCMRDRERERERERGRERERERGRERDRERGGKRYRDIVGRICLTDYSIQCELCKKILRPVNIRTGPPSNQRNG